MTTAEKAAGKSGSASGSSKTDASEGAASTDAPENESLLAWPKVIVEAVRKIHAHGAALVA